MLFANGLDDAIIGIGRRCGQPDLVVYSVEKCIQILVERDGIEEDEARVSDSQGAGAAVGASLTLRGFE